MRSGVRVDRVVHGLRTPEDATARRMAGSRLGDPDMERALTRPGADTRGEERPVVGRGLEGVRDRRVDGQGVCRSGAKQAHRGYLEAVSDM
jgi:hypothetical protein